MLITDLKFLIISYLPIDIIAKLCQINQVCQDNRFWGPLVDEIKYLENKKNKLDRDADQIRALGLDLNSLLIKLNLVQVEHDLIEIALNRAFINFTNLYKRVTIPRKFYTIFADTIAISNINSCGGFKFTDFISNISSCGAFQFIDFISQLRHLGYHILYINNIVIGTTNHNIDNAELDHLRNMEIIRDSTRDKGLKIDSYVDYLIN